MMKAKSSSSSGIRAVRKNERDRSMMMMMMERGGRADDSGRISPSAEAIGRSDGVKILHKNFYRKFKDDFDDDDI
jgi:hypothetical protein